MDLNDTPEQAEYRARARDWLEQHADEAPKITRDDITPEVIDARRKWQGKLAEAGFVGITWPREYGGQGLGPLEQVVFTQELSRAKLPGILDVIGIGMLGPTIIAHGTEEQKQPLPRPDAARRRGLVPALLRARRGLRPGRHPVAGQAPGRRHLARVGPEGVDDQRAVRVLRPDDGPHRRRRPQAQGPDHVRRAHGRRRRDRAAAAPDLRRGPLQRGLLRRRGARRGRARRPGRQWLGRGADHAHVRARGHRPGRRRLRLARRPLRHRAGRRRGRVRRPGDAPAPGRGRGRPPVAALHRLPAALAAAARPGPRPRGRPGQDHHDPGGDRGGRPPRRRARPRRPRRQRVGRHGLRAARG